MKIFYPNSFTGTCFGQFYVCFRNSCFPNKQWEDFYVNIITDWIETICEHSNPNLTDFRLDFMEADYYFLCTKNHEKVTIIAIWDHKTVDVFPIETISFEVLKNTVLSAGKNILNIAKANNYCNLELAQLANALHNAGDGSL